MYNRFTHNGDNIEFCSPCYLCKHPEERPVRNKNKCNASECDYLKCYEALSAIEDKLENASKVEIHYKPPYEYKYAVVEYSCRKGRPLKVAEYYIYGEELKTGKHLICWSWIDSTNFNIKEDNFSAKEEATTRLRELKLERAALKQ